MHETMMWFFLSYLGVNKMVSVICINLSIYRSFYLILVHVIPASVLVLKIPFSFAHVQPINQERHNYHMIPLPVNPNYSLIT